MEIIKIAEVLATKCGFGEFRSMWLMTLNTLLNPLLPKPPQNALSQLFWILLSNQDQAAKLAALPWFDRSEDSRSTHSGYFVVMVVKGHNEVNDENIDMKDGRTKQKQYAPPRKKEGDYNFI